MNNFYVENGTLMNKTIGCGINNPALIMMRDIGTPLKIGEQQEIEQYFNDTLSKNMEIGNNLELIIFNEFDFTKEQICDILNYIQNHTLGREQWGKIKSMDKKQLEEFFKKNK